MSEVGLFYEVPCSAGKFSKSSKIEKLYPASGVVTYGPYSRLRTSFAPYLARSAKHLTLIETRILVLDSGVEMWNVTPSKSETIWSMLVGVGLDGGRLAGWCCKRVFGRNRVTCPKVIGVGKGTC